MSTLGDWREKGFADSPRRVIAEGDEILYRCFGGPNSGVLGRWFAPLKCSSVSDAELANNVVVHGNKLSMVATFRVRAGTEMWVGRVDHGARDLADRTAIQVYIERPLGCVELTHDVETLRQDVFVNRRTGNV
ncbi:MAG: hypothetical protein ABL977_00105 [Candidatus Eisenbacteria bacterium]